MNNWKTSLYVQIAYMIGMGAGLLFMPDMVLGILNLEPSEDIWIRVLGLLALVLTLYYRHGIQTDSVSFARTSVFGRMVFCIGLAALALQFDQHIILLLAGFEFCLALWTMFTTPKTA